MKQHSAGGQANTMLCVADSFYQKKACVLHSIIIRMTNYFIEINTFLPHKCFFPYSRCFFAFVVVVSHRKLILKCSFSFEAKAKTSKSAIEWIDWYLWWKFRVKLAATISRMVKKKLQHFQENSNQNNLEIFKRQRTRKTKNLIDPTSLVIYMDPVFTSTPVVLHTKIGHYVNSMIKLSSQHDRNSDKLFEKKTIDFLLLFFFFSELANFHSHYCYDYFFLITVESLRIDPIFQNQIDPIYWNSDICWKIFLNLWNMD